MSTPESNLRNTIYGAVGALGILTTVGFTWIIPTMNASRDHKIELLQEEIKTNQVKFDARIAEKDAALQLNRVGYDQLTARVAGLLSQIEDLERKAKELSEKLFTSEQANVLSIGNPYPMGLDQIRIGEPIEKAQEIFKERAKADDVWSRVELETGLFRRITYYPYSKHLKRSGVGGISFDLVRYTRARNNLPAIPDGWLDSILRRTLGTPYLVGEKDRCLMWRISDTELVFYYLGEDSYDVSGYDRMPAGCSPSEKQLQRIEAEKAREKAEKAKQ